MAVSYHDDVVCFLMLGLFDVFVLRSLHLKQFSKNNLEHGLDVTYFYC